jgi:3,4-dehydroadipyl-CoA semialdehyde dehydrogenase
VPAAHARALADALVARLALVKVGDPRNPEVTMGPVVSKAQQLAVHEGIAALATETASVIASGPLLAENPERGAFVTPTLLICLDPASADAVHRVEVFGPVATLIPYAGVDDAFALAHRGGGSLVASVFSADARFVESAMVELAPSHGRLLVVDASVAKAHTGHGVVMPTCIHGGPGRAGGGEELGGLRGLWFYLQRTALQGHVDRLRAVTERAATIAS